MRNMLSGIILVVLLLSQIIAHGVQNPPPAPGPQPPLDKRFDHLKIENVDKMPRAPHVRDPAEVESERKSREIEEKIQLLKDYRMTGTTRLSSAEIENLLEACGVPKNHPRFISYSACRPNTDLRKEVCGIPNSWTVLLKPSVRYDQVDATVERLFSKYRASHRQILGAKIVGGKPVQGVYIANAPVGALLNVEMSEDIARKMSEEPEVRYVAQLQQGGEVKVNGGYGDEAKIQSRVR